MNDARAAPVFTCAGGQALRRFDPRRDRLAFAADRGLGFVPDSVQSMAQVRFVYLFPGGLAPAPSSTP